MITLIALFLSAMLSLPSLAIFDGGERIQVTFEPGAIWACTVYEQQDIAKTPLRDGSIYAPQHCWGLDRDMEGYEDDWAYIRRFDTDWLVWAFIQYEQDDGSMLKVETNRVEVHR